MILEEVEPPSPTQNDLRKNKFKPTHAIDSVLFVSKKQPLSELAFGDASISAPIKDLSSNDFDKFNNILDYEHNSDRDENDIDNKDSNVHENDFVEFQINKPRYAKEESVKMVQHNFKNIESEFEKKQRELHEQEETEKQKQMELKSRDISHVSELSIGTNEDSEEEDGWKEIGTKLDCSDIYNLKGERIQSFIHSQESLTKENTTQDESKKKKDTTVTKVAKTSGKVALNVVGAVTGVNFGKNKEQLRLQKKYEIAHLHNSDSSNQGYTRIDIEDQAKKFGEMDKQFDFLFQKENSNLRKLHAASSSNNASVDTLKNNDNHAKFINDDNFDDIFINEGHEEEELDPNSQLMSTKTMLTDPQKIAYVALVKLIIVQLNTELIKIRGSGSTKILKKLANAQKSFMRWSIHVMDALYDHLDVNNPQERNMIETLSCHGVEVTDLTKWFDINVTVKNSLKNEKDEVQLIGVSNKEIENDDNLEIDVRWTLICDLFLILLESSVYDSRSRTLLLCFAETIGISHLEIFQFERRITDSLEIDEALEIMNNKQTWDEKDILKEHKKRSKNKKIVKIALATAAGGLVIGLSAGALAPVIGAGLAAGLTTIGISGTTGFLAGTAGTAIITTGGVLSGMRVGQSSMNNRAGSVKTFEFIPLHNNRRVNLIITVSGWMSGSMDDIRLPFSTVDQVMGDLYSLLWEPEMLTSMGQTINILANEILTQSIQQILGNTLLITLMAGLQLPMMLSKLGYLLDNPWNVSLDRAWSAGKVLADTLRRNKLGVRPITLVGFSLGARLIYSCLLSLAKTGDYGLIENAYLFGSPVVIKENQIAMARSVVSGRFINGYVKQDWILGYLFRATSGGLRTIAGLSPVCEGKYGIENVNCSEHVNGHMQYREAMPKLLKMVDWEVLDDQFVEIEQPNPEQEERQRKLLSEFEKAQNSKKKKTWYNKWFGKKNKEWWEMYQEGENEMKSKESGSLFDLSALTEEIDVIEKEAQTANKDFIKMEKLESKDMKVNEDEDDVSDSERAPDVITAMITGNHSKTNTDDFKISTDTIREDNKFSDEDKFEQREDKHELHLKQGFKQGKGLRHRTSLLALVEAKSQLNTAAGTTSASPVATPPLNSSQNGVFSPNNHAPMRQFRLSSASSNRSAAIGPNGHRSPSFNLNVVQGHSDCETSPVILKQNVLPVLNQSITDYSKGEKFGGALGIHVNEEEKESKTGLNDNLCPEPVKNSISDVNEEKTDYGEYEVPTEENLQICFDDDLENIEREIKEKHKEEAGIGPVSGFDYGDEDEFPHDESGVQFSFT